MFLGRSTTFPGNYYEGIPLLEQSLALYRTLGDNIGQAMALGWLGNNHNDLAQSKLLLQESLRLHRELGNLTGIAYCLAFLGYHTILAGNFSSPGPWLEEARTLYHELGDQPNEADALEGLGVLADRLGDYQRAYSYFEQSIALYEKAGGSWASWPRVRMGHTLLREGNITQARELFETTLLEFQKNGPFSGVIYIIEGLASGYVNQGDAERATRLFAWADARREELGNRRPPIEQMDVDKDVTTCLSKMGEVAFSDAYEEGKKMSLEEAVAYALEES